MEFGFQELLVLITLNMCIDGLLVMKKNLLLESISQVKDDFISVGFDSKSKEINFKFYSWISKILKSQSEFSAHDKDLNSLSWDHELAMSLKEVNDMAMWKDNFSITKLVRSLIHDKNRNEINQLNDCLLILIHLSIFDLYKLVRNIFSNVKNDFILEHVLNHLVILYFQQL